MHRFAALPLRRALSRQLSVASSGGSRGGFLASPDATSPRTALLLAAAGLIPFVFYAAQHESRASTATPRGDKLLVRVETALGAPGILAVLAAGDQAGVRRLFESYGAVILSFMGGVHWGAALRSGLRSQYLVSVVPSLLGWAALNTRTDRAPPLMLAVGFFAVYAYDELMISRKVLPLWYSTLRTPVTLGVIASCLGAAHLSKPLE